MDSDFDNVTWSTETDSQNDRPQSQESGPTRRINGIRPQSAAQEPRPMADPVDLAGIGPGSLDCEVGAPLKENEGTKDVYVSYLITTTVRLLVIVRCNHPRN